MVKIMAQAPSSLTEPLEGQHDPILVEPTHDAIVAALEALGLQRVVVYSGERVRNG